MANEDRICSIINHFGEGAHPYASPITLQYFEKEYVGECIEGAIEELTKLNEDFQNG